MELMERIEQQMAATQLPLFAITLAAVPCPDTPVILTLHWHAFVRERLVDSEDAEPVAYRACSQLCACSSTSAGEMFSPSIVPLSKPPGSWAPGTWRAPSARR